jgi:anti-sigma B factor antagonist
MPEQSANNEELTSAELDIRQRRDRDGFLTLELVGELDLATAESLATRLRQLRHESYQVRLDLSRLSFIDSRGLQLILLALEDARRDGWELEVGREVSPQVENVVSVSGIAPYLWPPKPD